MYVNNLSLTFNLQLIFNDASFTISANLLLLDEPTNHLDSETQIII